MRVVHSLIAIVVGTSLAVASSALAQQSSKKPDDTKATKSSEQAGSSTSRRNMFSTSKLRGMKVRNTQGENLGEIEDLIVDMDSHRVRYATLEHGGVLGVGEKRVPLPIEALALAQEGNQYHFVVDIDKETLKRAPNYDKDALPDFNPAWLAGLDKHYGRYETVEGTVDSAEGGKFQMTDRSGKKHSYDVSSRAKVEKDGQAAGMKDVQRGQSARVIKIERDGKDVVVSIQLLPPERTARQPN